MRVSRLWLEKFFDSSAEAGQILPSAQELSDMLTFHAFEIDSVERVGEDDVLDVKVTPNRGHDALSHRGIAKELSAILSIPLINDPLAQIPALAPTTDAVSVSIQRTDLCNRYIAGVVKGVKVGPSPLWLRERLAAIGQRSINNVVDATNFVMFNIGQPLHAFDAAQLGTENGMYAIEVRAARVGEVLLALDEKKYGLSDAMLVIGDAHTGATIGIAGVKGGMPAAITEATDTIIVESANFDGASVRRTAAALKLRTDASSRFEQVLSPELAAYGMQSAVELIRKLAGGELVGYADSYPNPRTAAPVSVSVEQINAVLGISLTGATVADALNRLGLSYAEEGDVFSVTPPFERLDISIPEDLIEEVARIVGYDKVPAVSLPPGAEKPTINQQFVAAEATREELMSKGYSEVITSVFADTGEVSVVNKLDSVRPYLRGSLLPGITEAWTRTTPNKDLLGLKEVKLFEIGPVWKDGKELTMVATIDAKGNGEETPLQPSAAEAYAQLPLSAAVRYQPFSKYPYIVRDIALWVPGGTEPQSVLAAITKEAGELAVRVDLFDRFEKEGRVSLAFRIIFQSFERTLTETEVHTIMETVSAALREKGFEIR